MKLILVIIGLVTGMATMFLSCSSVPQNVHLTPSVVARIKNSPLYDQGKFQGVDISSSKSFTGFVSTAWDFMFGGDQRTPNAELPLMPVDLGHFSNPGKNQLNATWLGHSSVMVNIDGYRILFDPVFEKSLTIIGPSRYNGEAPLDIQALPDIDLVIISHDHYDHLNQYSIVRLNKKTTRFLVPFAVGSRLRDWGVSPDKIVELAWWEEHRVDENLLVAATPAQHFSGRSLLDRNKTLWASWVVIAPRHRIFFSGDSGYFKGFKQIGDKYGPFDLTFIECGAYNPSWHKVHMFPEETVQAHLDLRGNLLHPIHWGTFNLSLHAWFEPMVRLTAAAEKLNIATATPIVGQTTVLGKSLPAEKWWEPLSKRPREVRAENTIPRSE